MSSIAPFSHSSDSDSPRSSQLSDATSTPSNPSSHSSSLASRDSAVGARSSLTLNTSSPSFLSSPSSWSSWSSFSVSSDVIDSDLNAHSTRSEWSDATPPTHFTGQKLNFRPNAANTFEPPAHTTPSDTCAEEEIAYPLPPFGKVWRSLSSGGARSNELNSPTFSSSSSSWIGSCYRRSSRLSTVRWLLFGLVFAVLCWYAIFEVTVRAHRHRTKMVITGDEMDWFERLYDGMFDHGEEHEPANRESSSEFVSSAPTPIRTPIWNPAPPVTNLTHLTPLTHLPCSACSFTFPRPPPGSQQSSFFVTAIPDLGAGVGHQFTEWIVGPYLAEKFNITYVISEFGTQSSRWNAFLGFLDGELRVDDLPLLYGNQAKLVRVVAQRDLDITQWCDGQLKHITADQQLQRRIMEEMGTVLISSPSSSDSHPLTLAHSSLSPNFSVPILLQVNSIGMPKFPLVCAAGIHRTIRQKYCLARLRNPVRHNLYADDRRQRKIIIAYHLRCGDSCFSTYRTTSFDSIVNTCWKLNELFQQIDPSRRLSFHFFSQSPPNNTAEDHFAPLMQQLYPLETHGHWHTKSTSVMHHLIMSDILIGAVSGFSWLAFLLHNRVVLGLFPSCTDQIHYDKLTGEFNQQQFINAWSKYKDQLPKFESFQDCLNIQ